MVITELQQGTKNKVPVQIFATDLSDQAIRDARVGMYTQSDVSRIPKAYRDRFFVKAGEHFKVNKELREMCIFAPHNILKDPPFSRIDLISCCNLLIYFDGPAQKKALASLNFALNDHGFLILGKSESIGSSSQFFTQLNYRFKIFSRKKNNGFKKVPELLPNPSRNYSAEKWKGPASGKKALPQTRELDQTVDSILLAQYMPACAVINADMEILKFRGGTDLYLSHPAGNASLHILKMARPELALELRGVIQQALKSKQAVRKEHIEFLADGVSRKVRLEVHPLAAAREEPFLLVLFLPEEPDGKHKEVKTGNGKQSLKDLKIKKLAVDLARTRAEMHSIIESQETAYEDLQAANEEIVSTNEEFQTLNEELETSKEEIEATNEELISTNQELQMRNDLLTESYRYSEAIIATVHEPMLILDRNFHIKSANRAFYKKFQVNHPETEGASLFELGNKQWEIPELRHLLDDLLANNIDFKNLEVTHSFPAIGERIMLLNAHRIVQKTHNEQLILLAIEDITERTLHYQKEKELLRRDIRSHEIKKAELEKAVEKRTRQLRQKNLELEDINKDLTAFTYISSHDLQEPLRKIRNFISVLMEEERERLSEDGKNYLTRTYDVARRMQSLIEDLLVYSRTNNIDRKYERSDLRPILQEIKKEFAERLNDQKAVVKIGHLGQATIIPFQFHQLMHNLVSNSLKFSSPRRKPRISVKSEIVKGTQLRNERLSPKLSYCHIIYTDNGIGFDTAYNERIFEVFQRLHNTDEYKGTGMGLAICKRIVENHHGAISATGHLHKGARFDIYIPV
jgi:two-component system CheB/CheR fusion protein